MKRLLLAITCALSTSITLNYASNSDLTLQEDSSDTESTHSRSSVEEITKATTNHTITSPSQPTFLTNQAIQPAAKLSERQQIMQQIKLTSWELFQSSAQWLLHSQEGTYLPCRLCWLYPGLGLLYCNSP